MIRHMHPAKSKRRTLFVRISGSILAASILWNLYWIAANPNLLTGFSSVFSYLFLAATMLISFGGMLMIINSWSFHSIKPMKLMRKDKPHVGIIMPTCGEPVDIVMKTLASVATQDWPKDRRVIIVSDDGRDPILAEAVKRYALQTGDKRIVYYLPPHKYHPNRVGESKAGNLNAALYLIYRQYPHIKFIETRDADDTVGTPDFLSYCVGHLVRNPDVSFVQTIKECMTYPNDPFSNNETAFYQMTMPSRNAVNAAFPCGSGLVWRKEEIVRIGGFPHWNLVEDLQSGFEVLKRGGKGAYLPIVGALAQVAPEDLANFYKQRGTWALDSYRLFIWHNPLLAKGLDIWQKLQFLETEFSYILSYSIGIFVVGLIANLLFGAYPVSVSPLMAMVHYGIFVAALELFHLAKSFDVPYRDQSTSRRIWLGMSPVYMFAGLKALFYGPNDKPTYKVTRKNHEFAWYWKETLIQKAIVALLSVSVAWSLIHNSHDIYLNVVSIFWALYFIYGFSLIVQNSWHGIDIKERAAAAVRSIPNVRLIKRTIAIAQTAVF